MSRTTSAHRQTRPNGGRRGTTSVELALVAPLFFLFLFGAIEFSRMNMVRHTIDIAAYEGARRGIIPGATVNDVRDRVDQVLAQVGIANTTVAVTPQAIDSRTSEVTVDVTAPMDDNGFMFGRFFSGMNVTAQSRLAREGYTTGP